MAVYARTAAWKAALEVLRLAFALNDIRFVQLEGGAKAKKNAAKTFAEDDGAQERTSAAPVSLAPAQTPLPFCFTRNRALPVST